MSFSVFDLSAFTIRSFKFRSDRSGCVRTSLVNSDPSVDSKNWNCFTRHMDVTSDTAIVLKTLEVRDEF